MENNSQNDLSSDFETIYRETPKYESSEFFEQRKETILTKKQKALVAAVTIAIAAALTGVLAKLSTTQNDQKKENLAVPSAAASQ